MAKNLLRYFLSIFTFAPVLIIAGPIKDAINQQPPAIDILGSWKTGEAQGKLCISVSRKSVNSGKDTSKPASHIKLSPTAAQQGKQSQTAKQERGRLGYCCGAEDIDFVVMAVSSPPETLQNLFGGPTITI